MKLENLYDSLNEFILNIENCHYLSDFTDNAHVFMKIKNEKNHIIEFILVELDGKTTSYRVGVLKGVRVMTVVVNSSKEASRLDKLVKGLIKFLDLEYDDYIVSEIVSNDGNTREIALVNVYNSKPEHMSDIRTKAVHSDFIKNIKHYKRGRRDIVQMLSFDKSMTPSLKIKLENYTTSKDNYLSGFTDSELLEILNYRLMYQPYGGSYTIHIVHKDTDMNLKIIGFKLYGRMNAESVGGRVMFDLNGEEFIVDLSVKNDLQGPINKTMNKISNYLKGIHENSNGLTGEGVSYLYRNDTLETECISEYPMSVSNRMVHIDDAKTRVLEMIDGVYNLKMEK